MMKIKELKRRPGIDQNKKLSDAYAQFDTLLLELRNRHLPEEIITDINTGIDHINSVPDSEKELKKQLRKTQSSILRTLEKKLKVVVKNHYRNLWMVLGMSVFGVPLGTAFGVSLGNMGYLGIGLPIGMAIGLAVGSTMDKKALEEGRQLNLEIK